MGAGGGAVYAVPATVRQQVKLWERERNRVTHCPGSLHQFRGEMADAAFDEMVRRLDESGFLLWHSRTARRIIVKASSSSSSSSSSSDRDHIQAIIEGAMSHR